MPADSRHHKKKKRFTILFIPNAESENPKSLVIGRISLAFLLIAFVGIIFLVVAALFVYTPLINIIPITNPELENRYGKQIVEIQSKLNNLLQEVVILRQYNLQLRKALGEKITDKDSLLAAKLPETAKSFEEQKVEEIEPEIVVTKPLFVEEKGDIQTTKVYYDLDIGMPEFPLIMPLQGFISRGYDPVNGHYGIDIVGREGSFVSASASGTVVFSDWTYDYGFMLIIAHGNGYLTIYKHNQRLLKSECEFVKRGETITLTGNTGKQSTGPHLHFEVWKNGIALDPREFILNIK